jgi:hypothetical protein
VNSHSPVCFRSSSASAYTAMRPEHELVDTNRGSAFKKSSRFRIGASTPPFCKRVCGGWCGVRVRACVLGLAAFKQWAVEYCVRMQQPQEQAWHAIHPPSRTHPCQHTIHCSTHIRQPTPQQRAVIDMATPSHPKGSQPQRNNLAIVGPRCCKSLQDPGLGGFEFGR